MASQIDITKPAGPISHCEDMRLNFSYAKSDIETLQTAVYGPPIPWVPVAGGGNVSGTTTFSRVTITARLNLAGAPRSPTGLISGDVWLNGDLVMVVP